MSIDWTTTRDALAAATAAGGLASVKASLLVPLNSAGAAYDAAGAADASATASYASAHAAWVSGLADADAAVRHVTLYLAVHPDAPASVNDWLASCRAVVAKYRSDTPAADDASTYREPTAPRLSQSQALAPLQQALANASLFLQVLAS